ncbi:MAG TPA: oligoendopeptidase F [Candidatus Pygmaiobacter gallistercoris]|nr:oligoendopeptidase F [Candidatus Pygmaiobacter gallistercoris]
MDLKIKQDKSWNLADMFADDAAWEKQMQKVAALGEKLAARKGRAAADAQSLLETLRLSDELNCKGGQCAVYAECRFHTDMSAARGKEMNGQLQILFTRLGEQTAFLEPELMRCGREQFENFCSDCPDLALYRRMMEDLFDRADHLLDDAGEALLTRMADLGGGYRQVFDDLVINDTPAPQVEGPDGEPVKVTEAGYFSALQNADRPFRARYYNALLGMYGGHINTLSSSYYGRVRADVYLAKSRRYPTARAAKLAANFVPEEVYDNLIATVRANCGPLQEYVALRKKVLGIDDFHFYDFFLPLTEEPPRTYPFEEAAQLVLEATAPLGEDYAEKMRRALENRWIDVYPKDNKQSGAYSTGTYGFHPYMLLNYDNTLEDVFTLVHELGHSMHTMYSCESQPFVYSDYSIFCAEVASTTNEQLLYYYLLGHCESDDLRRLLLSKHLDDLRSTFYRQTMLADFEMQTHARVEAGQPLLPDVLCDIHAQLNRDYYGPELVVDKSLSYEWSRIPHYYRAFYVYQYATGISAAIAIANRIRTGVPGAVEDYKKFLCGGCSEHPIELLRYAGVDMAQPQPILDAVAEFRDTLEELKKLL